MDAAENEIGKITINDFLIIGAALYWAEGSKQNKNNASTGVKFSNSDADMIILFLSWLKYVCKLSEKDVYFEIYIHENYHPKVAEKWWIDKLNISADRLKEVYLKRNKIKTKRKNTGNDYHGLIRVCVKSSTNLNRRIQGWIAGIKKHCPADT
jgi:hypothetical protein